MRFPLCLEASTLTGLWVDKGSCSGLPQSCLGREARSSPLEALSGFVPYQVAAVQGNPEVLSPQPLRQAAPVTALVLREPHPSAQTKGSNFEKSGKSTGIPQFIALLRYSIFHKLHVCETSPCVKKVFQHHLSNDICSLCVLCHILVTRHISNVCITILFVTVICDH